MILEEAAFILQFIKSNSKESFALISKYLQDPFNPGSTLIKYEQGRKEDQESEIVSIMKEKENLFPKCFLQVKLTYTHKVFNGKQWEEKRFKIALPV